jgi:SSS family solute:Na+ symporter
MPSFEVTGWDLGVLALYVLGSRIFFGWWLSGRASEGAEGYFLAGRRMTWPLIGLSFYVSNMSGSSFVGLPSSGYADGVGVYHYEWLPALILVVFVFFVLPFYLGAKVSTSPEYLERRFSRGARIGFSVFLLLANVFIDAAAALYAGATVAQTLFPEISIGLTVAVTAAVAGLYIFVGGLGAVVVNDALQAVVILLGGSAVAILAYLELPSWSAVQAAGDPEMLSLIRPATDEVVPWTGVVTGVVVIGLYFWCANQFVIQRALAARDLGEGRKGALFAGLLKLPNLFILILPGVFARVLYPELERPDLAFPVLAFDLLPVGLRGLMLAALAAAILSSLEAILNSASTLFTLDLVKTARPDLSEAALVGFGRASTLGFMVLAATWAPQIADFPSLWRYLQSILAYVTPPVVAVFGLGLFSRRANARGAILTFALMLPAGVAAWLAVEVVGAVDVQFLHASGMLFAASLVLGWGASHLAAPPPPEVVEGLTWSRAYARAEARDFAAGPWTRDPRVLSAGLLALAGAVVAWWW